MRSDFIGNCDAFLGLPEAVSRSQFLVPRLDRKQMEEAITRPGEVKIAAFQPFSFQQDLVNRIEPFVPATLRLAGQVKLT